MCSVYQHPWSGLRQWPPNWSLPLSSLQHMSQMIPSFKISLIMSLCLKPWRGCYLPQHRSQRPFCCPQALHHFDLISGCLLSLWSLLFPRSVKYVPIAGSLHFVFLFEPQSLPHGFLSHIRCFLVCGTPLPILYEALPSPCSTPRFIVLCSS